MVGGFTSITGGGIRTPTISETSLASKKNNIKKIDIIAIELIKNADICSYNLNEEKKGAKEHIGLVIGDGYNCPKEVIAEDEEGVEQYSMTALAWKAIQELIQQNKEQQEIIKSLTKRIEKLEEER